MYKLNGVVKEGLYARHNSQTTEIWKGRYKGEEVALKVIRVSHDNSNKAKSVSISFDKGEECLSLIRRKLQQFCKEVVLMKQEEHDHILPFYGVSEGISEFCLVFPLYQNGNIMEYLEKNPTTDRSDLASTFQLTAHYQRLLEFREQLLGAVSGLRFLHGVRLVHGALQPVSRTPCSLKVFNAVNRVTY